MAPWCSPEAADGTAPWLWRKARASSLDHRVAAPPLHIATGRKSFHHSSTVTAVLGASCPRLLLQEVILFCLDSINIGEQVGVWTLENKYNAAHMHDWDLAPCHFFHCASMFFPNLGHSESFGLYLFLVFFCQKLNFSGKAPSKKKICKPTK